LAPSYPDEIVVRVIPLPALPQKLGEGKKTGQRESF
jgi:hypothetical protein